MQRHSFKYFKISNVSIREKANVKLKIGFTPPDGGNNTHLYSTKNDKL